MCYSFLDAGVRVARGLHDGTGNQSGGAYSDRLRRLQKLPNQHVEPVGLCDDCTNRNNYPDSTTTSPTGPPPQGPNKDTTPSPLEACECKCGVEGVVVDESQKPQDARSVSEASVHLAHPKLHARVATSDYESSDSPSSVETSEEAIGMGRVKLVAAAAEGAAAVVVKEEQEEDEEKLEEERQVEEEEVEDQEEGEEEIQAEVEGEAQEKTQQVRPEYVLSSLFVKINIFRLSSHHTLLYS